MSEWGWQLPFFLPKYRPADTSTTAGCWQQAAPYGDGGQGHTQPGKPNSKQVKLQWWFFQGLGITHKHYEVLFRSLPFTLYNNNKEMRLVNCFIQVPPH